jgi:GTPase SAR1 family protein
MLFKRNPRFTGRQSKLSILKNLLSYTSGTIKVVITGLEGVGKTQLVIKLAHRIIKKQRDCSIF